MPPRPPSRRARSSLPKHSENPVETTYAAAVEAFVRRDHVKTCRSIDDLIHLLSRTTRNQQRHPWYNMQSTNDTEETYVKTFKLYIGARASLYSDHPDPSTLPPGMKSLIPPTPPGTVLEAVYETCRAGFPESSIPPALVSTFILASLKLQPQSDALSAAHGLTESWLAAVPSSFLDRVALQPTGTPEEKKRVEAMREGYLRVLELFVGELLGREGEWEMARAILDGDSLLPSKRRESLYRHLRALEQRANHSSLSSSGILPSPSSSGILSPSHAPTSSASSSTSSSELTARPKTGDRLRPMAASQGASDTMSASTSIAKQTNGPAASTDSDSTLPSRIIVNRDPGVPPRRWRSGSVSGRITRYADLCLSYLPEPVRSVVQAVSPVLSIPVSIIALVIFILVRWRRSRRGQGAPLAVGQYSDSVAAGAGAGAGLAVEAVRARLSRARQQGVRTWIVWFFKWWVEKFAGVWKLGTTITYV